MTGFKQDGHAAMFLATAFVVGTSVMLGVLLNEHFADAGHRKALREIENRERGR